ncbi:hypothetical protein BGZ95_010093 [Linnemannia exigua]|uniref:Voltage-gated hydrogen channel 1 n=1 Tax=Linnemannia exigua TaxID=604196 RepID=A0AAD4DKK7_9FUNG|nr:hypothetical protein BGZ95_010093 [Linnemannia exigua]
MVAFGNYGEPPLDQFYPPPQPHLDGRCCTTHEQDEERFLADATCLKRTRYRIGKAIESKGAHIAILVLTLCDIILVMLQIGASLLHLDETEHEHWVLGVFEHLSLTIISIFMLEILLKVFAFGPQYFWIGTRHWILHLVDATIIVTSFMLEIFLKGAQQELSSLLIVFRLWRVVKLTGTVAVEVSEHGEAHVALLEERVRSLEQELEESRLKIQRLEGFNVPRA